MPADSIRARHVAGAACAALAAGAYWTTMSSQSQLWGDFPRTGRAVAGEGPPAVALTFDDGPNEPFTGRLLDVLAEYGVRATFFQVGRAVERHPDLPPVMAAAGHAIGNHSYHHEFSRCFTRRSIDSEIARAQDVLGGVLGAAPTLFRPPWLVRTPATFAAARRQGLSTVSGTFCHPLEVAQIDSRRIARAALHRAVPQSMIIFHDGYNGGYAERTRTIDAVRRTVEGLSARGWAFVTVPDLLPGRAAR